jgi:DNA-binding transcriptional LysR family regulator
MRVRNLASFVKVAKLGSFRAASSQLHISQPAVSARINALEDELGVQLFRRGKSGTHLTQKGTALLDYAENILALSEKMQAEANEKSQLKGTLKVGVADTLAHLWLSPLLQQWQKEHPQMSFELTSDVTPVLTKQLQHHQIDLSLMVSQSPSNSAIVSEVLCRYPQVWVQKTSSEKPIGEEPQVWSIAEMAKQPILSFPRETAPWQYCQKLFKHEQAVIHTCSSVASLISLAEQGVGIALLPLPLVEDKIRSGSLKVIVCEMAPIDIEFCCSWRVDEETSLPKLLANSAREIVNQT